MEKVINITPIAATVDTEGNYNVGVALSHIYTVKVGAAKSADEALLKFDDWMRGTIPAESLPAEIVSSEFNVIGIATIDEATGKMEDAGDISAAARSEIALRGALPKTGAMHLFPAPPTQAAQTLDIIPEPATETLQ